MTRKDYILIAEVFRITHNTYIRLNEKDGAAAIFVTAGEMANALQRDNPRFSSSHFLTVVRGEKPLMSRPGRS